MTNECGHRNPVEVECILYLILKELQQRKGKAQCFHGEGTLQSWLSHNAIRNKTCGCFECLFYISVFCGFEDIHAVKYDINISIMLL